MGIARTFRGIYKPKYIAINIAAAVAYFFLMDFLLRYQNYGTLIVSVPMYVLYLLSITASISLTIGIYSIGNTRNNLAKGTGSTAGTVSAFAGSLVGGCGCHAPLLATIITLFGFSGAAFPADVLLTGYATEIFAALIIINIAISIYYLNRLSDQKCRIDRRSHGKKNTLKKENREGGAAPRKKRRHNSA